MSPGNWSDRYANAEDLAAALDKVADRAPVVTEAANALRARGVWLRDIIDLANDLDEHANFVAARWGAYEHHAAMTDAAMALRGMAADNEEGEWWGDDSMRVEVLTLIGNGE